MYIPLSIPQSKNYNIYVICCHFQPAEKTPCGTEKYQKRLLGMVESWGFQLHSFEGDGTAFFCNWL